MRVYVVLYLAALVLLMLSTSTKYSKQRLFHHATIALVIAAGGILAILFIGLM